MNIVKKFIAYNTTPRNGKSIDYIVIHDVGTKGSTALDNYNYFNGGDRGASVDFFVDTEEIIQTVYYMSDYSWHCGDGEGKNGIKNNNSIGIEMCLVEPFDKVIEKTIELVKYLMKELDVPVERVVRHYDASGKKCPGSLSENKWEKWNDFKNRLKGEEEMIYNYIDDNMPTWARPTIQKLVDKGYLKGNEKGELGLNDTMLRIFVVNDRAGLYGEDSISK